MLGQEWIITVTGYGSFGFLGTEEQAGEMRAHKARWEGVAEYKIWRNHQGQETDNYG